MVKIGIIGAAGRMGKNLITALASHSGAKLTAAVEYSAHPDINKDAAALAGLKPAGVPLTDDPEAAAAVSDVLIDFSSLENVKPVVSAAVAGKCGLVIGTTGLGAQETEILRNASASIPVFQASNYSLGVNLLANLVRKAATILGNSFDIEIIEAHHRFKKDAPSGTALTLAEAAAEALDRDLSTEIRNGRSGMPGERTVTEIGMHAIRGGDVVGDHTVGFYGDGERIELTHKASSRMTFANGAVRSAVWLVDQKPGKYSMDDVLNF